MDFEQPVEIDLKENGGKQVFRTFEKTEAWLGDEISFYEWTQALNQPENPQQLLVHAWQPLVQGRAQLQKAKGNPAQAKAHLDAFANNVREAFLARKLPHSTTARGKFIEELRVQNPRVAAFALAYFIQIGNPNQSPAMSVGHSAGYAGLFQAFLFEQGIKVRAKSEASALTALHTTWSSSFEDLRGKKLSLQRTLEELEVKASGLLTQQGGEHTKQTTEQQARFDALISECQKKLISLEKFYNDQLALRAPVTYWENRRKKHRNLSWIFGLAFAACAASALSALYFSTGWMLSPGDIANGAGASMSDKISYQKLSVIALYAVVAIWVLRLLARLLLSNIHLGTDAGERVVMAMTYLALLQEEKATTDQDRSAILQALFRPSVTGVVQDDGLPHVLANLLTKEAKSRA